jgi:uncharacterized DUF497 family protein
MDLEFDWDNEKARSNDRKHGVSFAEASTVFGDPLARLMHDSSHSDEEDRFVLLGESKYGRMLIVVFTDRDQRIRIISAREATRTEKRRYEEEAE